MKKQYEKPYAEKVEFDYKDSVAACFSPWWPGKNQSQTKNQTQQNNVTNQQSQNCQQGSSWWVNQNVGKQNNPYWGC